MRRVDVVRYLHVFMRLAMIRDAALQKTYTVSPDKH